MSGGAAPSDGDAHERVLDQEMKEDAPVTATETTWSFVQMNMTLLPIARPLPVSITNRVYGSVMGRKPRTPTQKLHHRVLRNASNISPRRNEDHMLRRRGSTSSENGMAASYIIPRQATAERQHSAPNPLSSRCGKRKSEDVDHYMASPGSTSSSHDQHFLGSSDESRGRSFSEDLTIQGNRPESLDAALDKFVLTRSASTSSAFAQRGLLFKDKRILEIQDEERRLHPDERATLPSPSKRSRWA